MNSSFNKRIQLTLHRSLKFCKICRECILVEISTNKISPECSGKFWLFVVTLTGCHFNHRLQWFTCYLHAYFQITGYTKTHSNWSTSMVMMDIPVVHAYQSSWCNAHSVRRRNIDLFWLNNHYTFEAPAHLAIVQNFKQKIIYSKLGKNFIINFYTTFY